MNNPSETLCHSSDQVFDQLLAEITDKIQAGESVEPEQYAAAHPEFTERLRKLLPSIRALAEFRHSGEAVAGVAGPEPLRGDVQSGVLGDFRIFAELGRGGMGVVYEAQQISIGRRVALKVLPFAAVLDQRQLSRFRNEVQAAGQLHHTNIVPVYAVGSERGVHYYAMQLITGQTLTEVIADLHKIARITSGHRTREITAASRRRVRVRRPSPVCHTRPRTSSAESEKSVTAVKAALSTEQSTRSPSFFRAVAQLGVQAAEALEHAHANGVFHRDIKPSNLLVDMQNHLWVTDFGLARIESNVDITMTGDVLGTLRYMSPEQAVGKRTVVDHRADIYSLGITLYELLTLQPAFDGVDRQQLLRQIGEQQPASPHRLNPSIPADLETIILKAIAKDPADRYESAQLLADDLRHFLRREPIQARRPSLLERATKWSRRHVSLIVSTAVVLALAVVGLTVAMVGLSREQAVSEAQHQRADANLGLALEALDQIYSSFAGERLTFEPEMTPVQRDLLQKAVTFYQQFAKQNQTDPSAWPETARAYRLLGTVQAELGDEQQAEHAYRESITILESLLVQSSREPRYQVELAYAQGGLGNLLRNLDDAQLIDEADQLYVRAIGQLETLVATSDDIQYQQALAAAYRSLGVSRQAAGQNLQAAELLRHAMSIQETLCKAAPDMVRLRHELGGTVHHLAGFKANQGKASEEELEEARQLYEQAIAHQQAVLEKFPGDRCVRQYLRNHYRELAITLSDLGRSDEAEKAYSEAISLAKDLLDDFPNVPGYRSLLAVPLYNLGKLLEQAGKTESAKQVYRDALPLLDQLVDQFPDKRSYRQHRAMARYNLALQLAQSEGGADASEGKDTSAEVLWKESLADWEALVERFPGSSKYCEYQARVGATLNNLALLALDRGEASGACGMLERALEHQQIALRLAPTNGNYLQFLRNHYGNLARALLELDDHRQAAAAAEQLAKIRPDHAGQYRKALCVLRDCEQLVGKDAALTEPERAALAHSYAERASELNRMFCESLLRDNDDPTQRYKAAREYEGLGAFDAGRGSHEQALAAFEQAIALLQELVEQFPDTPAYNNELASAYHRQGTLYYSLGRGKKAESAFQSTLQIRDELVDRLPDVLQYKNSLADILNDVATLYWDEGRLDEAERLYRRVVSIEEQMPADLRGSADYLSGRGATLSNLAGITVERGDLDTACELFQEAIASQKQALNKQSQDSQAREFLQKHLSNLAKTRLVQARHVEAAAVAEELVQSLPDLLVAYINAAELHMRCAELARNTDGDGQPDTTAAQQYTDRARELLQESAQASEQAPDFVNRLAWILSTHADATLRDLPRALTLAEGLVNANPERAAFWRTLGVARYRSGEWPGAITALTTATELSTDRDVPDGAAGDPRVALAVNGLGSEFFFLAMSHWYLDDKDNAHQWYAKGLEWLERNKSVAETVQPFRDETARLLGSEDMREAK